MASGPKFVLRFGLAVLGGGCALVLGLALWASGADASELDVRSAVRLGAGADLSSPGTTAPSVPSGHAAESRLDPLPTGGVTGMVDAVTHTNISATARELFERSSRTAGGAAHAARHAAHTISPVATRPPADTVDDKADDKPAAPTTPSGRHSAEARELSVTREPADRFAAGTANAPVTAHTQPGPIRLAAIDPERTSLPIRPKGDVVGDPGPQGVASPSPVPERSDTSSTPAVPTPFRAAGIVAKSDGGGAPAGVVPRSSAIAIPALAGVAGVPVQVAAPQHVDEICADPD